MHIHTYIHTCIHMCAHSKDFSYTLHVYVYSKMKFRGDVRGERTWYVQMQICRIYAYTYRSRKIVYNTKV